MSNETTNLETTNQATANYTFSGSTDINTTQSNISYVTLNNGGSINLTKTANSSNFVPGGTITYYVTITNNGSQWFSGVRLTDNLTGTGYLTYVPNSAKLYINGQWQSAQVVSTNPLVCTLSPLTVGGSYVLMYNATVSNSIPASVQSLTNTATGIGYTYNSSVSNSSSLTLTRGSSTGLTVSKYSSKSSVNSGEYFNYVISLTNQNNIQANITSLTDQLPNNFTISTITLKIGSGETITLSPTDYTLTSSNLLTLPSGTGPSIVVPESSSSYNTTVITITGYFN